jgi:hypothetical protein
MLTRATFTQRGAVARRRTKLHATSAGLCIAKIEERIMVHARGLGTNSAGFPLPVLAGDQENYEVEVAQGWMRRKGQGGRRAHKKEPKDHDETARIG